MESDAETAKRALAELTRRINDAERRVARRIEDLERRIARVEKKGNNCG